MSTSSLPRRSDRALRAHLSRKRRWLFAIALFLILTGLMLGPAVVTYMKAISVLMVSNGNHVPGVISAVLDKSIQIEPVTIAAPHGPIHALLYTPAGHPDAPGMVIIDGLDPAGPRGISQYARSEAATGLRVLTPDIPQLDNYSVIGLDQVAVQNIGESVRWLAGRTGHPVSLMGISFSGGMVVTTAARPEYASSVKMVFEMGGYDDLARVLNFYQTGVDRGPDGKNTDVVPSAWVPNFLEYNDLMLLGSEEDKAALGPILKARILDLDRHPKNEEQIIAGMIARLTPEQRQKLNRLLDEENKLEFAGVIQGMQQTMRDLSPHGLLAGLTADVYILHGRWDAVIPVEEAQWLQKDLPPGRLKKMLISPLISHVNIHGKNVTWKDKWSLVHFMYLIHRKALAAG